MAQAGQAVTLDTTDLINGNFSLKERPVCLNSLPASE
jgi:hypothetical protein